MKLLDPLRPKERCKDTLALEEWLDGTAQARNEKADQGEETRSKGADPLLQVPQ